MALRRLFGTGSATYIKGSKGFNASVVKTPEYREGTIEDIKELSAASEFGEAKSFLERFEQVEKVNAKQAAQD
jgi:hypothetical protein